MDTQFANTLRQGCAQLDLNLSDQQYQALLDYLALLAKWNKTYNLTAIRDPAEMVVLHLLDSLSVAKYCPGQRLIDVGTGAGLPGIPLAILYPDREWHLLDSNGKKTRFLFQVKTALGLDNMTVHHQRVENYQPTQLYDGVLSRAFASLADMVNGCKHLLTPEGSLFAMKGLDPQEEILAIGEQCRLQAIHRLTVPGLEAQRHLVELKVL